MRLDRWSLLLLALIGCGSPEPDVSSKARVMPKNGAVWGRDLANALGLQTWDLCKELGTYDCIEDAHRIALGGVEPTSLGIDEPLAHPSVSAPIAVDRVATAACGTRYTLDAMGTAVIFGPVLNSDTPGHRAQVAETLVTRLLGRESTKEEVEGLVALYDTLAPLSDDPVRSWSIGACVVVATSTEALFY